MEDAMPGLARKLLIFAAVDGLFLQPVSNRDTNVSGVRIEYGSNRIVSATRKEEGATNGLEAYGIVGLLDLVKQTYLISITRREEAAQIRGHKIFKITDVTLIPLKSKEEAEKAIVSAQRVLKQETGLAYNEEADSDAETASIASVDTVDDGTSEPKKEPEDEARALEPSKSRVVKQSTSFVKDVVQDKGKYGRFASKWFSRNGSKESARRQVGLPDKEEGEGEGLTREQSRQMDEALPEKEEGGKGESAGEEKKDEEESQKKDVDPAGVKTVPTQSAIEHLTPRILRSARLYFSSSGFYFSYDHDLSKTLAHQDATTSTPLYKRFDSLFFWNRNLMKPFINAGQDSFVLPLLQGFIGQRSFTIAETEGRENDAIAEEGTELNDLSKEQLQKTTGTKHDLLLTLISRRSIKRAGLRYLRRGVDDEGAVANSVETEQILSTQDWDDAQRTFSLVQIRGSMPLFFSQSPYSFKPVPVFFGSEATNQTAFKKHFRSVMQRYGQVQCVSLVDKKPPENTIGELYEKHAKILNDNGGVEGQKIGFEWFDFHGICKGMKFENVSVLMDTLRQQLDGYGWNEQQSNSVSRQQQGVLRTNCMDCLDRTNVVQSAVAGWALEQQLAGMGLNIDLKKDPKTQWFNTLWADNGDSCSKQYAGTSALKGDFTRTRKRNWTGALSDFSLTLNRYYNNIFGDYFLQTNIDYYLGNAGPAVFDEFETDMTSQDYALDMRSIRQNAIDTCIKIVLEDPKDDLQSGWTLSAPAQSNTLKALPFEECVLLLTDAALYFCRFDWDTEKVGSFERLDLRDVKEMWRGAYITSALGGTHLDEKRNVGFALRYDSKGPSTVRTNTRSLSVAEGAEDANDHQENDRGQKAKTTDTKREDTTRLLAFKALPPKAVAAKDEQNDLSAMSEGDMIKHICEEIQRAITKAGGEIGKVEEKDLISVAEAKRSTGYMESLGYSLKKLVWS